jgi:hypothetical protein
MTVKGNTVMVVEAEIVYGRSTAAPQARTEPQCLA